MIERAWAEDEPHSGYQVSMTLEGAPHGLPVGLVSSTVGDEGTRYAWQQEYLVGRPLEVVSVTVYEPSEADVVTLPTEDEDGNPTVWDQPGYIYVTMREAS